MTSPEQSDEKGNPATPRALPELHGATLRMDQVHDLLDDIAACTELLKILPKYAVTERVPDRAALTLDQAAELLRSRAVRGLQLRYRYEGAVWCDTLMQANEGYRIVRIRHDF
jgi:rhamnogalacturonyl hydrolase YesR